MHTKNYVITGLNGDLDELELAMIARRSESETEGERQHYDGQLEELYSVMPTVMSSEHLTDIDLMPDEFVKLAAKERAATCSRLAKDFVNKNTEVFY